MLASDHAARIVSHFGGTWHGDHGFCHCPVHADGTPSLSVRLGRKAILFHCFAGCPNEEILAAIRAENLDAPREMAYVPVVRQDYRALALDVWRSSEPAGRTLAARYLSSRAIDIALPPALRFVPVAQLGTGTAKSQWPAMIAAAHDNAGFVSIQRTFLDPSTGGKAPVGKAKRALGKLGRAAIRLSAPASHMGLAEGIEDALSVTILRNVPCWAAAGIERYCWIEFPPAVRSVTIYSQPGLAAEAAIDRARQNFARQDITLSVELPPGAGDWNDFLQARRGSA
ncbi:toprim domain-containing protein [Sphingomonas mollis]|uniref:Toprim domain-containing protein n=1 Tax=Sphingomonas mollis TaxID=2795726 RepID=A0ABS0XUA0_9SPHN|nr:toprim domain-containing protein [Sphingomonas sp. BT553]MBJ6123624.1 toprim domain-containing protein [Sphingomonas sp. BT553]